jgi:nucleotide-binding universal stress UspA family protein
MFRDLLVAFDGSSHAQRALAEARDLAQATAGRLKASPVPVLVVHVPDDPPNEQQ